MFVLLLPHIKVNGIADYYAVPRLCHLANVEIQNILGTSWSPHGFSAIVEKATCSTGDKGLHTVLTVAAAENIGSIVDADENIPCVDVANTVIRKMVAANRIMQMDHAHKIRVLKQKYVAPGSDTRVPHLRLHG